MKKLTILVLMCFVLNGCLARQLTINRPDGTQVVMTSPLSEVLYSDLPTEAKERAYMATLAAENDNGQKWFDIFFPLITGLAAGYFSGSR